MRDRHIRTVFLGLILALPPLILATSPHAPGSAAMACGIEAVLVVGLALAARERQGLRASEGRRAGSA